MPANDELAQFYPADYHSVRQQSVLTQLRDQMRIKRLAKLVSREGAILDHGCGDASFLIRAATELPERQFFGFEPAAQFEKQELSGGRITIIKGSLADLRALSPRPALITMNHVIEHLPSPIDTLHALKGCLVPGGVLEGQTPRAGSLEHRVFGTRWSGYHAPRHTVIFSAEGLRSTLARAGFNAIALTAAFNPAALAVSLLALRHEDRSAEIQPMEDAEPHSSALRIPRTGAAWLSSLGLAVALAPFDLLADAPGVMNFSCRRPEQ